MSNKLSLQGLFILFACVGSGDPVRVLHLYTTNTLDTLWSIYCWDICTTCCYQTYVLSYCRMCPSRVLSMTDCWMIAALYCAVPFIVGCVDISRMVFWDRSVLRLPGEALILVAKLSNSSNGYTSLLTCFTFSGAAWVHWEWWGN